MPSSCGYWSHNCHVAEQLTQRVDRSTMYGICPLSFSLAAVVEYAIRSFTHFTGVPALFARYLLGVPES